MNISQNFKLKIKGHKDIDFIDIDETRDTKLFIDPYAIQALPDEFCTNAHKSIDTFFKEVFKSCRNNDFARLRNLLKYASEPNETNLGMKRISKYGKGTTANELTKIFSEFYKTVRKNPYIENNPLSLCMYIKNFDKDKMSDLITNIIRKHLYDFTVKQSNIWGMKLKSTMEEIGYHWDCDELRWKMLNGNPLFVSNKNILLVPKSIVRNRYVFNVECYIKQYILKISQQRHLDKNTDMCVSRYVNGKIVISPPTIKELYKKEVNGTIHKDFAFQISSNTKTIEDSFIQDISRRINDGYGSISDRKLDEIVYKKDISIA